MIEMSFKKGFTMVLHELDSLLLHSKNKNYEKPPSPIASCSLYFELQ